jgi:hypothetical protein
MGNKSNIYVYPKLSSLFDVGIRIGGFGLANCMFVYARAIILADETGFKLINPTWQRFGIGQYLRNEKDKRNYLGLFYRDGMGGFKKYLLLLISRKVSDKQFLNIDYFLPQIIIVSGVGDFFFPLLPYQNRISEKFRLINKTNSQEKINYERTIGIHVRLGDFINEYRTPINWYLEKINYINQIYDFQFSFILFSDGTDEELKDFFEIQNLNRSFNENAFADIISLSRCCLILGSDSTFSGWASFLGQKPSIFYKKHFGQVLVEEKYEIILPLNEMFPILMKDYLNKILL